jgi:hypothetical protein
MTARHLLPAAVVVVSLFAAGCGGEDDASDTASEAQATPAQAVAEIGRVRGALDDAMGSLAQGDRAAAREAVSEGYVEHFEKVEGPLEKMDAELNEQLEEAISTDLRQKIADGAPRAEIRELIASIRADLATAERKLR